MATASDNFDRSDGGLGANWTEFDGSGTFAIVSQRVQPASYSADAQAMWNATSFGADQFSQITLYGLSGTADQAGLGVCLRATGSGASKTFYRVVVRETFGTLNVSVARWVTNSYTLITQLTNNSFVDGDVLRAEVEGTTIRVYRNGTQFGGDITDSNIASGQPGIDFSGPQFTGEELDAWSGGDLSAGTDATVDMTGVLAASTASVVAPPKPRPTAPFSEINVRM